MESLYVIGNGMHFGTAMEGQLKMMETQCIPSMFNDLGEFSHGMHRALTIDSNVILINTEAEELRLDMACGTGRLTNYATHVSSDIHARFLSSDE